MIQTRQMIYLHGCAEDLQLTHIMIKGQKIGQSRFFKSILLSSEMRLIIIFFFLRRCREEYY